MIDYYQDPPAPHFGGIVLFSVLAAALLGYSYPNILTGNENASMMFSIGGTLALFDAALVIMWISGIAVKIAEAWHNANDPFMRRTNAVSKLKDFQIAAMPRLDALEVGIHVGNEINPYLITLGGLIPFSWIGSDFLPDCTIAFLKPIRRYADGTIGRNYAQWITDYLINRRMVMAYDGGPNPAQWCTPDMKLAFIRELEPYMNIIGISLDPFEHGDPGEHYVNIENGDPGLEARDWS